MTKEQQNMSRTTPHPEKTSKTSQGVIAKIAPASTGSALRVLLIASLIVSQTSLSDSTPKLSKKIALHHFDLPCETCHDPFRNSDETGKSESIWKSSVNVNEGCTLGGCHEYDRSLNHPINVTVPASVTKDLTLDSNSRINCLTCHDSPQTTTEFSYDQYDQNEKTYEDRQLKIESGIDFCASCHSQTGKSQKEQSHWQFSNFAHLTQLNPDRRKSKNTNTMKTDIDSESRRCLSCHEEVSAVVPSSNETSTQRKMRWKNMSDHPIGMNYQDTANRGSGEFVSSLMGDREVRLFDGKVGCGSCHSLYKDTEANLVEKNTGGNLCRKCHLK